MALTALLGAMLAVSLQPSLPLAAQRAPMPALSQLTWFSRTGTMLGRIGPLADHGNIELSPDGTRVAVAVLDQSTRTRDLWFYDTKSGARSRFTSDATDENWLAWSPDGTRVVLNSLEPDRSRLLESPAGAYQPRSLLRVGAGGVWPMSWSPDGRTILYVTNTPSGGNDIWMLPVPVDGSDAPAPFQHTRASENWAAFSPNGRWVVFSSTATSTVPEVLVTPFPDGGQTFRISADGGSQARWRRDGEIVYLAPDRMLMSATVTEREGRIDVARIEPLFAVSVPYGAYHGFDVSPDGARILANVDIGGGVPTQQARAGSPAW